ncbi:MAG: ABC-F family ATP-binding cassette domain-containing protein [Pseudomonadales bacterium]|nr:ABC-F family ATP-binding cassette domain-containing protein [Pseudomonadales bacterium]
MSSLLQCHRLTHAAGTKMLFKSLNISINDGDRIGLVGHNGSGKSTLLSILSGSLVADDGDLSTSRHLHLETVEQFISDSLNRLSLISALAIKLPTEDRQFKQYQAEQLLSELGFSSHEFSYLVSDLSGGQQNRLMFARAIINKPNLILFDEPTNHLDLKTLLFFEGFLNNQNASYIIISHDRQFLDAVTDRTLFLRDEKIYNFNLPYTLAKEKLDEEDAMAEERRKEEEKAIKDLSASAKRLALWGKVYDNEKLARKAKNMEKRIEKLEGNKTFVSKGSNLNLSLEVRTSRVNRMLHIENQDILSPGNQPICLFRIKEFFIRPGDRIALLGHNGTGKTTLIKQIIQHYNLDRESDIFKFNPQCDIGYYDQEIDDLDLTATLIEVLRQKCLNGTENEYKTALIKAGFPFGDLDKKVSVLSGGEKARLMFLVIKLNRPNFLILDEPTNHIDIQGKEELETQILEANATVLITSHDRRFVDNIAERYVLIQDGKLTEINDPQWFYDLKKPHVQIAETKKIEREAIDSEEDILERILELESLLAEDKQRKIKFQKPKLQLAWDQELSQLNEKIS